MFDIIEANHARMRKMLSIKEFMIKNMNDIFEEKLVPLEFKKYEPFVLVEGSSQTINSKLLFILDLPSFEWDISKSVVLEFLEQMAINNLQEVPWNYEEPILLSRKRCLLSPNLEES